MFKSAVIRFGFLTSHTSFKKKKKRSLHLKVSIVITYYRTTWKVSNFWKIITEFFKKVYLYPNNHHRTRLFVWKEFQQNQCVFCDIGPRVKPPIFEKLCIEFFHNFMVPIEQCVRVFNSWKSVIEFFHSFMI